MTKDQLISEFREIASDPSLWRTKAIALRSAADDLWDSSLEVLKDHVVDRSNTDVVNEGFRQLAERLHISQLLYGHATEAALKARILENDPNSIEFREHLDGDGNIVNVSIKRIGVSLGIDGHDLNQLAEVAGVAGEAAAEGSAKECNRRAIHEILAFLTYTVRWSGRYPAPKKANGYYQPRNKVPKVATSHYMRDWLDPFLDVLLRVKLQPEGS